MLNALRLRIAKWIVPRPYHCQRTGGRRKVVNLDVPPHVVLPLSPEGWAQSQMLVSDPPDDPPDNP